LFSCAALVAALVEGAELAGPGAACLAPAAGSPDNEGLRLDFGESSSSIGSMVVALVSHGTQAGYAGW